MAVIISKSIHPCLVLKPLLLLTIQLHPFWRKADTVYKQIRGNSVDESDQFFLVVRRGSSFQRQLKIWQRESKRSSPWKVQRVHFAREDSIDTGAMAQEFLSCAMHEIEKQFFLGRALKNWKYGCLNFSRDLNSKYCNANNAATLQKKLCGGAPNSVDYHVHIRKM